MRHPQQQRTRRRGAQRHRQGCVALVGWQHEEPGGDHHAATAAAAAAVAEAHAQWKGEPLLPPPQQQCTIAIRSPRIFPSWMAGCEASARACGSTSRARREFPGEQKPRSPVSFNKLKQNVHKGSRHAAWRHVSRAQ